VSHDAIVIGAGVVGASVAWHLAGRGLRVAIIDRGDPGGGSTGAATGGFRALFPTEVNVRLSLLSARKLERFADETGVDPGFRRRGYLWLARTEAELEALAAAQAVQRAAGHDDTRTIGVDEIAALNPAVRRTGLVGGAFGAGDGFIRPLAILAGYLDGARRRGAELIRAEVVAIEDGPRVRTADGALLAVGCVVDAAGPWAARLADIPVAPLRRHVAETRSSPLAEDTPMTIWLEDGFHLRVRDGRVLLLLPTPGAADPFATTVDPAWVARVTAVAADRVPALAGAAVAQSWAGLYEMTPDHHALLGAAPGRPGLYLAAGSSGHGVMHAPALGQLLAEIIVDGGARALDVTPLRPSRFADGRPNPGGGLL
jgi:sarcosine oxidase subunit beta